VAWSQGGYLYPSGGVVKILRRVGMKRELYFKGVRSSPTASLQSTAVYLSLSKQDEKRDQKGGLQSGEAERKGKGVRIKGVLVSWLFHPRRKSGKSGSNRETKPPRVRILEGKTDTGGAKSETPERGRKFLTTPARPEKAREGGKGLTQATNSLSSLRL